MKFRNRNDVKKWLRMLPVAKKEMRAKCELYNELVNDLVRAERSDSELAQYYGVTYDKAVGKADRYRSQIISAKQKYDRILADWERLSALLDSEEVLLLTEKYLRGASWTAVEFAVHYSRRSCFRIQDRALDKLIGETVSGGLNV